MVQLECLYGLIDSCSWAQPPHRSETVCHFPLPFAKCIPNNSGLYTLLIDFISSVIMCGTDWYSVNVRSFQFACLLCCIKWIKEDHWTIRGNDSGLQHRLGTQTVWIPVNTQFLGNDVPSNYSTCLCPASLSVT